MCNWTHTLPSITKLLLTLCVTYYGYSWDIDDVLYGCVWGLCSKPYGRLSNISSKTFVFRKCNVTILFVLNIQFSCHRVTRAWIITILRIIVMIWLINICSRDIPDNNMIYRVLLLLKHFTWHLYGFFCFSFDIRCVTRLMHYSSITKFFVQFMMIWCVDGIDFYKWHQLFSFPVESLMIMMFCIAFGYIWVLKQFMLHIMAAVAFVIYLFIFLHPFVPLQL